MSAASLQVDRAFRHVKWLATCVLLVLGLVSCGDGKVTPSPPSQQPTSHGAGWIKVENIDPPGGTTEAEFVLISGSAFSGSGGGTSVSVQWVNAATGLQGKAYQTIKYSFCIPFLICSRHEWRAYIELALGKNVITVTASDDLDSTGNWAKAFITVTRLPEHVPPTVLSTIPSDQATSFPTNSSIIATFNEKMDAATITANSFVLYDSGGNRISGLVSYQNKVATFQPSEPLNFSSSYQARLTTDIQDISGNALVSPFMWSFVTDVGPDVIPPTVLSTVPANNDICVAIDGHTTAKFSETLQDSTINMSSFLLHDSTNNRIDGFVTYPTPGLADNTAQFIPYLGLKYSTKYVAKITSLVSDLAGNHLPADYSWSFTTEDAGTGTWLPTAVSAAPSVRSRHTTIWTGTEMIIWGGIDASGTLLNTGARYNPITDSWQPISTAGAPTARFHHTAIWTGSEMIIWGGFDYYFQGSGNSVNSGARYNPLTDTWQPLSMSSAPDARRDYSTVWAGSEMIVWGGISSRGGVSNTGAGYDPITDTWHPISVAGAPQARRSHTAVWNGSEMIIWGGVGLDGFGRSQILNTGGLYDPVSNSWKQTSTIAAPSPRYAHTAVWTGAEMIVWGGWGDGLVRLGTGSRYSPATDSWQPTATTCAASGRTDHTAIWTGTEMIIWSGVSGNLTNSGGRYFPGADSWQPTPTVNGAPEARTGHTAVWTPVGMVVWGGEVLGPESVNTGGRYTP